MGRSRKSWYPQVPEIPMVPCGVCDAPVASLYGVCQRTVACRREYDWRKRHRGRPATRYRRPTSGSARDRVVKPTLSTLVPLPPYTGERPTYRPIWSACDLCGHGCNSWYNVCQMTVECRLEWARRHREPGRIRQHWNSWLPRMRATQGRRPLRGWPSPCVICRQSTLSMYGVCRSSYECDLEYRQREQAWAPIHARLITTRLKRLEWLDVCAEAQGWVCAWCDLDLPHALSAAHLDHIIPVARGGPSESWNFQALHDACNMDKRDKLTPRALELAAAHGVELIPARVSRRRGPRPSSDLLTTPCA